jgi:two-component system, OmpR family, response regulator
MKILLIEDDQQASLYVARGLTEEGHVVDVAGTAAMASDMIGVSHYDILIVDRMLPGLDGLSFVKRLRREGSKARVLFLTALSGLDDRIEGLEAGGDDYLQKPFAFSELRARVAALSRRTLDEGAQTTTQLDDLVINHLERSVTRAGQTIDLVAKEYQLLDYLVRHRGRIVTRTMLLERVWELDFDPGTNVVESHMSRLRAKIDKPFAKALIKTIRGSGYRFDVA